MFNEVVKLVMAWRNGAEVCGDTTPQGISKAVCVNDALSVWVLSDALFIELVVAIVGLS